MILLWGLPADGPLQAVHSALERCRGNVFFLNQHELLAASIDMTFDASSGGTLTVGRQLVPLESLSAAYVRPYDPRRLPAMTRVGGGSDQWHRGIRFEERMNCWLEMTSARVINRPSAMASNNSKPYQLELLRSAGFAVPPTLVTTDAEAVESFIQTHGEVVYKSLSGIRSIVSRFAVAQRRRLADVANCPTQFQTYVPGVDVRVHVVGCQTYACEIRSEADDYRYAHHRNGSVVVEACRIPQNISERCVAMTESLGLLLAGFDFRRTSSDEYYCLEVNPSPGFTYYEQFTGQPIATAIARLLLHEA